ncbi:hypothetical protein G7Y79_00013g035360 [Physcia stellaris]|nr:hypothetical protein G7Y79_00013g035360 [Physcia stellaris]
MAHVFSNETGTPGPGPGQGPNSESSQSPEQAIAIGHLGVSMTLTAPRDIFVGEPFCWDIFVVNRSNVPRKLAVAVIPKRKKGDLRAHLSKSSYSSSAGRKDPKTAEAVVDENLLYTMQRNVNDAVNIVSLINDLKIGPLVPGSCFNGELKFLPLAKGVLQVEAVRVIEAITNESIDVRELPEIIANERAMTKD